MGVDIEELLRVENELKASCERVTSPVILDAKMNILKCLQVQTVVQFQLAYDDLYYELNKEGGLECLRSIAPARSTGIVQPKVLDPQKCDEGRQLEKQLQFYLADAELAKPHLDELVTKVAHDSSKYMVQCADVKSRESTRRKASNSCGGDVRKVADMARVTVICATPEALKEAYLAIMGFPKQDVLRVRNGFDSDWMPSGYRDMKLNPVVNDHLCEIQLHLREFFALKGGQHVVYEWARELNVTTEMRGEDLFKNVSPEVMKEMMRLARQNWRETGFCLPDLQLAAGQYDLAEESHRELLRDAENDARVAEDHDCTESRRALLRVNAARTRLALVLEKQPSCTPFLFLALPFQGKYTEADPLYLRAIEVVEKMLGRDHPDLATLFNNRAELLRAQGKHIEAEPLYARSHAILRKALGPGHPHVAVTLNNWAGFFAAQGKYAEAEPLYRRSQAIREKVLGQDHVVVATVLNNRAGLLTIQGKYAEADSLYLRAIDIGEKTLGVDHPDLAAWLNNRGGLLKKQGKYAEAEPLHELATNVWEKALGLEHPTVAIAYNNRAGLLRAQGNYAEAERLYKRSQAIREKVLGPDHPDVASVLNNRAELLQCQGKYEEARPQYLRAAAINEAALGPQHPRVAVDLNNQAGLLYRQGMCKEAEPLFKGSLAIFEKVYGPDHPEVATSLHNWARVLESQGKHNEAIPLLERAYSIRRTRMGEHHQHTTDTQTGLERVRNMVREQDTS